MNNIINADGLFNGDRFERVSDSARYAWPYVFLASNSLARIELNYHRVIGKAFSRFKHVPTEEEFRQWIKEFQAAYLLFVYQVDGTIWGQWDTSEKFLPKHKLWADEQSPAPDHTAIRAWREEYIANKNLRSYVKSIAVTNCEHPSELFPKRFGNVSETVSPQVGVGVGVGVGKNTCSTVVERQHVLPSVEKPPFGTLDEGPNLVTDQRPSWGTKEKRRAFIEGFWPMWPRKVAKVAAEKAWSKLASSPEAADRIIAAVRAQLPQLTADLKFCPYPASWLNDRRYEDDPPEASATSNAVIATDDYPVFHPEEAA